MTLKHDAISPAGSPLTNKQLISSMCDKLKSIQKHGPYSCPICGKGMGYSFLNLKKHMTRYKGHCKGACSIEKFCPCQYCGADFLSAIDLKRHNKLFGKRCIIQT